MAVSRCFLSVKITGSRWTLFAVGGSACVQSVTAISVVETETQTWCQKTVFLQLFKVYSQMQFFATRFLLTPQ